MILLVDIGNTNTKLKYSSSEEVFSVRTSSKYSSRNLEKLFKDMPKKKVDGAIISSVVPLLTKPASAFVEKVFSVKPLIVNKTLKSHIKYPMKDEENELGSDIFSALEASSLVIDTFLNIDLGTATTFNLVINNKFMGCAIAPGLMTSAKALVGDAAQIKSFDYDGTPLLLGLNTADSVEGGIINGWACIVDGYIRKIKEKYNLKDLRVFITGGDSRYILSELKEKVEPVKGLVFKGLESLFELNRG